MTAGWVGARGSALVVMMSMSAVLWPASSFAQSGPLTGTLPNEQPTDYAFRLGPIWFSPNVRLQEMGIDTNVFDEATHPKRDFTMTLTPDINIYARSGRLHFVGTTSNDFTYYQKYQNERAIGQRYLGRLELSLSRIRPWIAGAHSRMRTRPNAEIDLRAGRSEDEISTGLGVEVSPIATVFAMASRLRTVYDAGEIFRDIDLDEALSRRGGSVSGGVRIRATPFTTVMLSGGVAEERFEGREQRSSQVRSAAVDVAFSPEAVLSGRARLSYEDFRPDDPGIVPHRGLMGNAGLTFRLFGRATVATAFTRSVQHSFDEADTYFIDTGADVTWTHRVFGPYDLQARFSRQWLDYAEAASQGFGAADPRLNAYQLGVGYNLLDRSRIGLTFEHSARIAADRPDRQFERRRFFGSYTYGFR